MEFDQSRILNWIYSYVSFPSLSSSLGFISIKIDVIKKNSSKRERKQTNENIGSMITA